jgi:hypothetical protein
MFADVQMVKIYRPTAEILYEDSFYIEKENKHNGFFK